MDRRPWKKNYSLFRESIEIMIFLGLLENVNGYRVEGFWDILRYDFPKFASIYFEKVLENENEYLLLLFSPILKTKT